MKFIPISKNIINIRSAMRMHQQQPSNQRKQQTTTKSTSPFGFHVDWQILPYIPKSSEEEAWNKRWRGWRGSKVGGEDGKKGKKKKKKKRKKEKTKGGDDDSDSSESDSESLSESEDTEDGTDAETRSEDESTDSEMEEFLVEDDHVDSDREEKDAAAEADVLMEEEEEEEEDEGVDKEELLERKKQKEERKAVKKELRNLGLSSGEAGEAFATARSDLGKRRSKRPEVLAIAMHMSLEEDREVEDYSAYDREKKRFKKEAFHKASNAKHLWKPKPWFNSGVKALGWTGATTAQGDRHQQKTGMNASWAQKAKAKHSVMTTDTGKTKAGQRPKPPSSQGHGMGGKKKGDIRSYYLTR
ncbi:MAG: hypothetical protein CMI26_07420 [Opitutae bacterium]|nr:hypothetical protein [Opitutae bacterium]